MIRDEKFNPMAFMYVAAAVAVVLFWGNSLFNVGKPNSNTSFRVARQGLEASTLTPVPADQMPTLVFGESGMNFLLDMNATAQPTPTFLPSPTAYEGFQPPAGFIPPTYEGLQMLVTPYCMAGERCENYIDEQSTFVPEPLPGTPTPALSFTSVPFITFTPSPQASTSP